MGLVAAAVAAMALAGCYDPALRDCTVACVAIHDCADGQSCSAGMCAGPGVTCAVQSVDSDGGVAAPADADGAPGDAPAVAHDAPATPPDAAAQDTLRVLIAGKGQVVVDGVGTCTSSDNTQGDAQGDAQGGDCTYQVPAGVQVTAHAQATDNGHPFDKWTDAICKTQPGTCVFTPLPLTAITAHFK